MRDFGDAELGVSFQPFAALREHFGFIPNVFRAQAPVPVLIQAEVALLEALLLKKGSLSRIQKECILLKLAAVHGNKYCSAWHYQTLQLLGVPAHKLDQILEDHHGAGLQAVNAALLDFALKIGYAGAPATPGDVAALHGAGLADEAVSEAVHVVALGDFLRTVAEGVRADPDFATPRIQTPQRQRPPHSNASDGRLQIPTPAGLSDQIEAVGSMLAGDGALRRDQKDFVRLVVSLANEDVNQALLCERELSRLEAMPDADHLTESERAVIEFGSELDDQPLRQAGFAETQILEAVAAAAFANFLSVLRLGLGAAQDAALPVRLQSLQHLITAKKAHLSAPEPRHTVGTVDPDAECVAQVQAGELDAFEELMNRHHRRVYRTLIGILGDPDDARDAMQDTFLKAFQHLGSFEGRSKFSTWLLSIASNTAIQRLRDRKSEQSLDEAGSDSEDVFRPRQLQAWDDNPEQLYSQTEMRRLIERGITRLPGKYRVVLMLRDIEQMPIEETAAALGLGISAAKARLLRGRLMLREALAPHFTSSKAGGSAKGVTR